MPSAESRTDKNHVGAATAGDPYLPEQGNGGYRIAHYDLTLEYRMATDRLVGRAELTGRTTRKLARLSLDLSGLTVTKVSVNDHAARFAVRAHKLHVWPHHTLAADSKLAITVAYEGRPRPVPGPWGGGLNGAPAPIPRYIRPPLSTSSVLTVLTRTPGCR